MVNGANGSRLSDHLKSANKCGRDIGVLPCHSLLRNSELYGLRRNQSFNFQLATIRELMAISPFPRTNSSDAGSNPCSMSTLASKRQLSRDHSAKATIRPGDESAIEPSLRCRPWLGLQGWTCICFAFVISHMTIIQASTSLARSLSHHSANICRRTDLDRSTQPHSRRLGNDLNGVLQIKLSDMFSTCQTRDCPNRCIS
jgi:hypothetical protein